ncbi:MAG: DUF4173 domain-containing protein [Clostridiales Family XIII bacterium]|nr:DUF4173 domain-containing protein [Clostridiales Family XIII bacterium]
MKNINNQPNITNGQIAYGTQGESRQQNATQQGESQQQNATQQDEQPQQCVTQQQGGKPPTTVQQQYGPQQQYATQQSNSQQQYTTLKSDATQQQNATQQGESQQQNATQQDEQPQQCVTQQQNCEPQTSMQQYGPQQQYATQQSNSQQQYTTLKSDATQQQYATSTTTSTAGYVPREKQTYDFKIGDIVLMTGFFLLGLLFWECDAYMVGMAHLTIFLFFIVMAVVSFIYMQVRGFRQNGKSLTILAMYILAALPFLLYDWMPVNMFLYLFLMASGLLWIMYTCQTNIWEKLSGFIAIDTFNQAIIVPFANFAAIFASIKWSLKSNRHGKAILASVIGLVCAIPILALVLNLLISADSGFSSLVDSITEYVNVQTIGRIFLELLGGIPVAAYLYGSIYGNTRHRAVDKITTTATDKMLATAHILPRAALILPLALFNLIYVLFFIGMGQYLFSAFYNNLPSAFTYAEYARQGFFELCGVAAINLIIIAGVWSLARRQQREYPKGIRILTAIMSALTMLLVVTAMSKMLLYINTYGLTQLRIYTLWFMILIFIVFFLLLCWHMKPANVAKPIVIVAAIMLLVLGLSNSDGIIARYNVDAYEHGKIEKFDENPYWSMSDAVIPALRDLQEKTDDPVLQKKLNTIIDGKIHEKQADSDEYGSIHNYRFWNIQSARIVDQYETIDG